MQFPEPAKSQLFDWVYDCGSDTAGPYLDDAIEAYDKGVSPGKAIDFLVISHFDRDHIKGVKELLSRRRVNTLLLPFISFVDRMALAFEEEVGLEDEELRFFMTPSQYLADIAEMGIDEIVYVSGGNEPPSGGVEGGEGIPPEPDEGPILTSTRARERIEGSGDLSPFPQDPEKLGVTQGRSIGPRVEILAEGDVLRFGTVWEFVPYNDAKLRDEFDEDFLKSIRDDIETLCSDASDNERGLAFDSLKKKYKSKLGKSAHRNNVISLFLGSRPVPGGRFSLAESYFLQDEMPQFRGAPFQGFGLGYHELLTEFDSRHSHFASLMTGDGFLEIESRLQAFEQRFGTNHGPNAAFPIIFQVMHHGSKSNYLPGIADRISPYFSVFSSDPLHKWRHPDGEVWDEFIFYRPLQVMQNVPCRFSLFYERI